MKKAKASKVKKANTLFTLIKFVCLLTANKFLIFTNEALFDKNRAFPLVLAHAANTCFGCITREYFIPQLAARCKASCSSP